MTDRPKLKIQGQLIDNDEPKLSPEEQEVERQRQRAAMEAERRRRSARDKPDA
jgi:hypothetical protein